MAERVLKLVLLRVVMAVGGVGVVVGRHTGRGRESGGGGGGRGNGGVGRGSGGGLGGREGRQGDSGGKGRGIPEEDRVASPGEISYISLDGESLAEE